MRRPPATDDIPCNLCGARGHDIVGRADREGRALQTVMCRTCGFVFTNPRPSAEAMDAYYATEYRADYTGTAAPPLRRILRGMLGAQERRRALRELLRGGATLLDVGCGAGELVYLLRRDGIDASGLEPGREYAAFAKRTLDVPVQAATVEAARVAPGSQDVVTMFHSLEHVSDPKGVLRIARGWLKRGGTLVVEVPNVDSTAQAPSHRFHYAHLQHFSGATLAAVGEAAGLRHVRTAFSNDGGNVIALFQRDTDEERTPPGPGPDAERTRAILQRHTTARHYCSGAPYRRPFQRLAQRWREDRLLRRLRTVDALLAWARTLE